ncbi:substrate-binding domain-containing protein [Bacillus sp. MUM 13]|uniref:substrate-binding domain-containing protein n=1 Tax=Bacillus sp. MUM 13 TaxID=1678001 RepID=UPI0008F5F6B0|nr:substrate-binding domain-containing protein [Bacillus sp. MUM 13]OIK06474.1 hypothetical protein BIV59_21520 [Bacillus sp. MUM 13]
MIIFNNVDALIVRQIDQFYIPIVVIGKVDGNFRNVFSVNTNNYQDSFDLTQYLIDRGHRDIAYLHSSLHYDVSIDRLEGFIGCMRSNGLAVNNERIIDSDYTVDAAHLAAKMLIAGTMPTALNCGRKRDINP